MKHKIQKTTGLLLALLNLGTANAGSIEVMPMSAHTFKTQQTQNVLAEQSVTQEDIQFAIEYSLAIANSLNDMNAGIQDDLNLEVALQASLLSFYNEQKEQDDLALAIQASFDTFALENQDLPEFPGQMKAGVYYLTEAQIAAGWRPEPLPRNSVAPAPQVTFLDQIANFDRNNLKAAPTVTPKAADDIAGGLKDFFKNGSKLNKVQTNDRSAPVVQSHAPQTVFAQAINGFDRSNLKAVNVNDRSAAVVDATDMNADNQRHIAVVLAGEKAAKDHVVVRNVLAQPAVKKQVRFADQGTSDLAGFIANRAQNRALNGIEAIEAERAARQAAWLGLPE